MHSRMAIVGVHPRTPRRAQHPTARRITAGMEMTLLPDEAWLQTIAVNSPLRRTLIASHMRFIEWPQLHGDANKYWASLGPQFHGGPMVLNSTLMEHKAFMTSAMFARKVDPSLYSDVLKTWDDWFAPKLAAQKEAPRQPPIGSSFWHSDVQMTGNIPPATPHEGDPLLEGAAWEAFSMGGRYEWPTNGRPDYAAINASKAAEAAAAAARAKAAAAAAANAAKRQASSSSSSPAGMVGAEHHGHGPDEHHLGADRLHGEHDDDDHGHHHEDAPSIVLAFVLAWVGLTFLVGTAVGSYLFGRPLCRLAWLRIKTSVRGGDERKAESIKAF